MNNLKQKTHVCPELLENEKQIIAYLQYIFFKHGHVAPSHKTIGKASGASKLTGLRKAQKLESLSFFTKISGKKHWQTNVYHLSAWLKTPAARHLFYPYLLLAFNSINSCQLEYDTRVIKTTELPSIEKKPETEWSLINPFLHKWSKEIDMKTSNYDSYVEIKQFLESQTKLKVTDAGIYEMCIFPLEAVKVAFNAYNPNTPRTDPFKYICSIAWRYVQDKKLDLRRSFAAELKRTANIPDGSPTFIKKDEKVVVPQSFPSKNHGEELYVEREKQRRECHDSMVEITPAQLEFMIEDAERRGKLSGLGVNWGVMLRNMHARENGYDIT